MRVPVSVILGAVLLAVPLLSMQRAAAQDSKMQVPGTELRGQLIPRRFTTLASEVAAKVDKIVVREGDRFKDGQTLVSLDCSIQRAQLERARTVFATAERLHSAHQRLVELKSAGELESAASAMEAAKAKGELQVLQATLAKCSISAPFAGRVVEQKVRDQQFVQAGQALLDILDDSVLELEFIIPSRALAWLKTGTTFQIQVEEMGKAYPAKITRIGAKVDPVSQSVKVVGEIAGSFPELVAGMSGKILLSAP